MKNSSRIVKQCPRIEFVREHIDLQEIVEQEAFTAAVEFLQTNLHVPEKSAKEWLEAAIKGINSCGRDRYGRQQVCHTCYASQLDRKEADRKYNSSDKGKQRLQEYRTKRKQQRPKNQSDRLATKRNTELLLQLGYNAEDKIDLSILTHSQEAVFTRYFGLEGRSPMTLLEIAEELGCSKQNVAQLRDYALAELKNQQ